MSYIIIVKYSLRNKDSLGYNSHAVNICKYPSIIHSTQTVLCRAEHHQHSPLIQPLIDVVNEKHLLRLRMRYCYKICSKKILKSILSMLALHVIITESCLM